ncbi:MAG: hypothetical protein P4M11_15570 [Candidatus Pacebacteria bacterium]|nr:hypothetical protein [Candidatus Paceibacterota bacterium]
MALGLYRMPGATDNTYAYVYTNPDPECILTSKDRVFVIGSQVSSDMRKDRRANVALSGVSGPGRLRGEQPAGTAATEQCGA